MSCAIAKKANTSSNQASKDPGQQRCGYSNLGKIVINGGLHVADLPENPASRHPPKQKVRVRSSPLF